MRALAIQWTVRVLLLGTLCVASLAASAQTPHGPAAEATTAVAPAATGSLLSGGLLPGLVPVSVTASGNHADIKIGNALLPLADVSLDFDDASNLAPSNLGVTAQLVSVLDSALLARLPDLNLTELTGTLPLLLTIEPPANGGLRFRNTGRMEIHTHLLPYTTGSSLRVFKAPLLGPFRDVTEEIAQGSVRARTRYGGFSQFLILVDLRPTSTVIDEKIGWLRNRVAALPAGEGPAFTALLDQAQTAVEGRDFVAALSAIDAFSARATERAGTYLPNEWRATRDTTNQAGELIAGASTLRFSVAYLRDFGQ